MQYWYFWQWICLWVDISLCFVSGNNLNGNLKELLQNLLEKVEDMKISLSIWLKRKKKRSWSHKYTYLNLEHVEHFIYFMQLITEDCLYDLEEQNGSGSCWSQRMWPQIIKEKNETVAVSWYQCGAAWALRKLSIKKYYALHPTKKLLMFSREVVNSI